MLFSLILSISGWFSRKHFFLKIWKCCRTLFSMGPSERRDAYAVLSLYLSFFSYTDGCQDAIICDGEEAFDLRTEKGFWDDLKKGLVNCLTVQLFILCKDL